MKALSSDLSNNISFFVQLSKKLVKVLTKSYNIFILTYPKVVNIYISLKFLYIYTLTNFGIPS